MKKDKKKKYDDDDGRVIAPMNVEGMPWHVKKHTGEGESTGPESGSEQLTREEKRAYMWGSLKAALLIGAVYAIAFLAFILFCVFVWFR